MKTNKEDILMMLYLKELYESLHPNKKFEKYRYSGEWFCLTKEIEEFIKECMGE